MPRKPYAERLREFAGGKDLVTVPIPEALLGEGGACDACQSKRLVSYCGLWDRRLGGFYRVGGNCRDALVQMKLAITQDQWARSLPEYNDMLPGDRSWKPRERAWAVVEAALPTADELVAAYQTRKEAEGARED